MFGAVKSRAWRRWIIRIVVTLLLLPTQGAAQVPPPMPAPRTVEVFGQAIRYYEAGEGRVVILVHGLGSVRAPTLVVWGRDDALTALSLGERFHRGIAGSRLVVFEQCGHVPQVEKAADFNKALLEFLSQP